MSTPIFAALFLLLGTAAVALLFGYAGRRPAAPAAEGRPEDRGRLARWRHNLQLDLDEAGIDLPPSRFLLYAALAGTVTGLLVALASGRILLSVLLAAFISLYGFRSLYVGRLARKRRASQLFFLIQAAEDIGSRIEQSRGQGARDALASYGARATSKATVRPGAPENQIAKAINTALFNASTQGMDLGQALALEADRLGNRWFRVFTETFLANEGNSSAQVALAMRQFAEEVSYVLTLGDERRTALSMPLNQYLLVTGVVAAVGGFVALTTEEGAAFYGTPMGEVFLLAVIGYLYLGYRLQRRKLHDRY